MRAVWVEALVHEDDGRQGGLGARTASTNARTAAQRSPATPDGSRGHPTARSAARGAASPPPRDLIAHRANVAGRAFDGAERQRAAARAGDGEADARRRDVEAQGRAPGLTEQRRAAARVRMAIAAATMVPSSCAHGGLLSLSRVQQLTDARIVAGVR